MGAVVLCFAVGFLSERKHIFKEAVYTSYGGNPQYLKLNKIKYRPTERKQQDIQWIFDFQDFCFEKSC